LNGKQLIQAPFYRILIFEGHLVSVKTTWP
jgi:hypothetical protein